MLRRLLLLVLIVGASCATASAGRIYARRPNTPSPLYNLRLDTVRTTVTVRDLLAVTHVDETFSNSENLVLEGFYVFQLPDGATVDGLWMWVDGVRYNFKVMRKEEAKRLYDTLVGQKIGDPALLTSLGANRFQLKVFPIKPHSVRRIELEYFQTLPLDGLGRARYTYPMNLADYQEAPVAWTKIALALHSDVAIVDPVSNLDSIPSLVSRFVIDSGKVEFLLYAPDLVHDRDFTVTWEPDHWSDFFPVLNYAFKDTVDDPYFLLWTPVPFGEAGLAQADYSFVIDNSASMCGLRATLVHDAVASLLRHLQPFDRFRIVLFSHDAIAFPADTSMRDADAAGIAEGIAFLQQNFSARSVTNYAAGITEGLRGAWRQDAEHRMVFVTDGLPNEGPRTAAGIDSVLSLPGPVGLRFFPMTLYTDNVSVLHEAAKLHYGSLLALEQGDSLASALQRFTFDFTAQSVVAPRAELPSAVYDVAPDTLPRIANPSELLTAGRVATPGDYDATLFFRTILSIDTSLQHRIHLMADTSNPVQVARCWAAMRIARLLAEMRGTLDTNVLKQKKEIIIRLSERFSVLSPYTAFLVIDETVKPGGGTSVEEQQGALAGNFVLRQNYPNPFTRSTTIEVASPPTANRQRVLLSVFDAAGRLLRVLRDAEASPGVWRVVWDGRDARGHALAAGTYFCELRVDDTVQIIRMILVR